MATHQTTCAMRGNETLLSKRVFLGNTRPRFHSNFARWSDEGSSEARLAFDVSWDGPQWPENTYQGYSVLVALGKERLEGELVLLIRPEMEDLALAVADGDSFVDACSGSRIPAGAKVLGRVIAERQFFTEAQLFKKAKAFKVVEFAKYPEILGRVVRDQELAERIDWALEKAQQEFSSAVAYSIANHPQHHTNFFWRMMTSLSGSPAYRQLQEQFRKDDAQRDGEPDYDVDGPLKELVSLAFRAGQYAGPEPYMLDPEPTDYDAVQRLIAESLKRASGENDREAMGSETTEPSILTSMDLCSALSGMPTFQDERDRFRKADGPESRWQGKLTENTDEGEFDFPLRSMLGRWFRAGMLAARTIQEPVPAAELAAG